MKQEKRHYHPMVIAYFYQDLLNKEQLKLIPKSTRSHWRSFDQTTLFGYEWTNDSSNDFKRVTNSKIGFGIVRMMAIVYFCYDSLFVGIKSYKKLVKNNASRIITTIDALVCNMPLAMACKLMRISTHQYYRLKNKVYCTASVLNLCFKTHPHQLTIKETDTIRLSLKQMENKYAPLSSVYYNLIRSTQLSCSLSAFYKYAALFRDKIQRAKPELLKGFRATMPFDYIHVDTTFVPTEEEGNVRVAFVRDNYSKAQLNAAVVADGKSIHIRDLLSDTFEKFGLQSNIHPVHVVSDGGAENKGDVITWVNNCITSRIIKLTAKLDFPFSNSMSERLIYIFKHEFLKGRTVHNRQHLMQLLIEFEIYYNHNRFPIDLSGYTPMEVLLGAIPDHTRFRQQIQLAQKQRLITNQTTSFCGVCL